MPKHIYYPYVVAVLAAVVRACVGYWLYHRVPSRPAFARSNDFLKLVDLAGLTAFCGACFFMLLRPKFVWFNFSLATGVAIFDVVFRLLVVEFQTRQLQRRSPKWSKRDARKHVRRRATTTSFH